MKKRVIIGGGIIIVALVAISLRLFSFSPEAKQEANVSTATANNVAFSALVTPIASQVFAMVPDTVGEQFTELATSTRVGAGTRIKTSETGRAIVEGPHEAFLDFNAEIVIASRDAEGGSRIGLETGKTWSRVKKAFDQGEFYELETQNAVAVVRGTSFGLYFEDGDTTTLIVTEGEVHLIAKDLDTGAVLYDTETAVGPGKKAVRKGEEAIRVSAIIEEDKEEWFRFNNPEESASQNQINVRTGTTLVPSASALSAASSSSDQAPTAPLSTTSPQPLSAQAETFTVSKLTPQKIADVDVPDTVFDLYGTGLDLAIALQVGNYAVSDFTALTSSHIIFRLPRGFSSGTYTIRVKNEDGIKVSLPDALTINQTQQALPPEPPPPTYYP